MRFLTTVLAIIFIACACKDKSTSPLRKPKANKILLGSKKADSVVWKLVKSYDPYNKGYTYWADSSNLKCLVLKSDASFREFDKENKSEGSWYLNKEKNKLGFVYSLRNGVEINEDLQHLFFRYHIDTLYKDTLILAIQGRHGMLKQYYKLPDSIHAKDTVEMNERFLPQIPQNSLNRDSSLIPIKN